MTKPQRTSFAVIKHLLPPDAWAAWRNEVHHKEFDDEPVVVYASDTVLESLNLDFSSQETEHVFLILVEGDLQVKTFIYNGNTDGATGLVVLGDLRANTMLVGGQEIYVTGNLAVEELLWGDYNHGSLRVLGNAGIAVFAAVDYDVQIKGEVSLGINLTPEGESSNWQGLDIALLQATLIEEVYQLDSVSLAEEVGEEEAEVELRRGEETLSLLQAGKSLLKSQNNHC